MDRVISKINQYLSGLSGWLMIGMMLLLVCDVLFRAVGISISGLAELSVFVMIIVIYFGLARCEEHGEHVNLELVTNLLPNKAKKAMHYLAQLLAILTIALIFYAVLQNALDSFQNHESLEGTLELPIWPIKVFMVLGLGFFLLQSFSQLLSSLRQNKRQDSKQNMTKKNQRITL